LIELRYDYETYQQLTGKRRDFLERELRLSVYEYIHNRRYATLGDVEVKIAYDMFTRKLSIKAHFPDENISTKTAEAVTQNPAPLKPASFAISLKAKAFEIRAQSESRITVGRTHDNALMIENSSVSSVHAAFTSSANGMIYISDLGSSNGTFVNGVQIVMGEKTIVKTGDRIKLGDIEVALEIN
jgi:FHA domain